MAGSDQTVKVTLIAVSTPYTKGMAQASAATAGLSKQLGETNSKVKTLDSTSGSLSGKMATLGGGLNVAKVAAAGLVGSALVSFMTDAVAAASDLNETVAKTGQIFGQEALPELERFAEGAAASLGQSRRQALDAAATFGVFGKSAGLAGEDLTGFSTKLTVLASDMASFSNTSPEQAIQAIGAALRGESEPIRQFGVLLDDATLRQEALRQGLIETTSQALTPQQKVLASYQVILNQTADAQGDFARTSGGLANQQRVLAAEMENLKASLGAALLPAMTEFVKLLNAGLAAADAFAQAFGAVPDPIKAAAAAIVTLILAKKGLALARDTSLAKAFAEALAYAGQAAERAGGGMKGAAVGAQTFTRGMVSAKGAALGLKSAGGALMGAMGGPWGLAIAGATVAITSWYQAQENARLAAESFADTLDKQTGSFTDASRQLSTGNFFKDFSQQDYAKVSASLEQAGVAIEDLIAAYQQGPEAVAAFKEKFDAWQSSGAAEYGERLGNAYAALGRDMEGGIEVARVNAETQAKVADATSSAATAAERQSEAVQSSSDYIAGLRKEVQDAADAQSALAKATLDAADAALSQDAANSAMAESLAEARDALKSNGRTLDENTEKGRSNRKALRDIAEAARDQAEANLKAGESTDKVKEAMGRAREAFIRNAIEMGASRRAAEKMADKFGVTRDSVDDLKSSLDNLPKSKTVSVYAKTSTASAAIASLVSQINGMPTSRTIMVQTKLSQVYDSGAGGYAREERGGILNARAYAAGGYRPGIYADGVDVVRFAERGTGGEAYIPFANDWRRPRAVDIWEESGRKLGLNFVRFAAGGLARQPAAREATSFGGPTTNDYSIKSLTVQGATDLDGIVRQAEQRQRLARLGRRRA